MTNPVSADTTRVAFIEETTAGVTPATPVLTVARITSEGLSYNASTTLSAEFNAARQVTDVIVSGGSSGGDMAFELSRNPWFEMMLEGVFGNTWGATFPDRLEVGTILKTYSVEKTFPVNPTATPVGYEYQRVARAMVDAMTLTFTPTTAGTGTITLLGGAYTRDDTALAGATYEAPTLRPVMLGANTIPIVFRINGVEHLTWCISQIVVHFRNNGRAIECLGTLGAAEMALGRFECEITMDVYTSVDTAVIMDAFFDNTEVAVGFETRDAYGNMYHFEFDRCRIQSATQTAGGTGQDVQIALGLQALMGPTATPPVPSVQSCAWVMRSPETALDAPAGIDPGMARKAGGSFSPSFWEEYGKLKEDDLEHIRENIRPSGASSPPTDKPTSGRTRSKEVTA